MEPGALSSFHTNIERVVTHGVMLSVWIIIIQDKKLGVGSEGMNNIITDFPEVTEMEGGSGSELYWYIFWSKEYHQW